MNEFLSGRVIYKTVDSCATNILLDDIIKNISFFFDKKGIFHLTDLCPMSKYDFYKNAAQKLGYKINLIPRHTKEMDYVATRPLNTSLSSQRIKLKFQSPEEGLKLIRKQISEENYVKI